MSLKTTSFLHAVGMVVLVLAAIIGLFGMAAGHSGGGLVAAVAVASFVVLYRIHFVHHLRVQAEKAAYDQRRLMELLAMTTGRKRA